MNYFWYCSNCNRTSRKVFPNKMKAAEQGDFHRKVAPFPESLCKTPKIQLVPTKLNKVPKG